MPAIVSEKFHVHHARQFVESLSEGKQEYTETLTVAESNTTVTVSGNVFAYVRPNDTIVANTEVRSVTAMTANGTELTINAAFSTALTAETFVSYAANIPYDTYYLFVGRSASWPEGDTEDDVPTPTDASANTSFAYWRDILAMRRITDDDLVHVIPRYDWQANEEYSMYNHNIDPASFTANVVSGNARPMYVMTNEREVFKCIYDGRVNTSAISVNSVEPTTAGQELVSDFTTATGTPYNNYIWKYLFTVSSPDAEKYLTVDYIPLRASHMALNTDGDVYDDDTSQFQVFDHARTSNGGIQQMIVDAGGVDYANPPTITIIGDGTGAEASAVLSGNTIVSITMVTPGTGYSFATATLTANADSGSGATATPIISPRNFYKNSSGIFYTTNHGVNIEEELGAKYVMLYVQLYGNETGQISTVNEYRRIGIMKNPILTTGELAIANMYDMTTRLMLAAPPVASVTASEFTKDEVVFQPATGAYGIVVEETATYIRVAHTSSIAFSATGGIVGVGNGNAAALTIATGGALTTVIPDSLPAAIPASGVTAALQSVTEPDVQRYSGDILYVNQRVPVIRDVNQVEILRTILEF